MKLQPCRFRAVHQLLQQRNKTAVIQYRSWFSRFVNYGVYAKYIGYRLIIKNSTATRFHARLQFKFGKSQVQISARIPAILIEVFRGFLQSYQINTGIVP
jgi:hypothetical protein